MRADPLLFLAAMRMYGRDARGCVAFIEDWCVTYDPRNAGTGTPAKMPFILFERQREFVGFILACIDAQAPALIEKSRDMGATWLCAAISVWLWLFRDGAAVGWGSRKEQLVDRIGDPDSIFEKIRMLIDGLPPEFLPAGLSPRDHLTYMKCINPANGATITGEAGDNIGRGGRKLVYFKDESAHYERPEKIEAALGDNTRVQIDISSVNGLGNVFHRRRENGVDWIAGAALVPNKANVFVFDWRDHPAKTEEWYEARKTKARDDGLTHIFAQEVDRDYAASVENVIIPAEWVKSSIDAHLKLGFGDEGGYVAGLDVADGGGDRNALAVRKGVVLKVVDEWGEVDTGATARRAVAACARLKPIEIQYDSIGVGAGVKAETNRLAGEGLLPSGVRLVPWDAGAAVIDPDGRVIPGDRDSPLNKDFYSNLKAQAWWQLRRRFERTHRMVTEGIRFDVDDLISIPSDLPRLRKLEKELSQPTASQGARMRLVVDKMPEGTRSPNLADAVVMAFCPLTSRRTLLSTL